MIVMEYGGAEGFINIFFVFFCMIFFMLVLFFFSNSQDPYGKLCQFTLHEFLLFCFSPCEIHFIYVQILWLTDRKALRNFHDNLQFYTLMEGEASIRCFR